jgi:hypothetical protein
MRRASGLAALALACAAAVPPPAESAGDAIRLAAAPPEIRSGGTIVLTGALLSPAGAPLGGAPVELQADPYPYRGFFDASHTTTAVDGSFAFPGLRPDRNTRYRVRAATGLSRPVDVYVDAPAVLHSYDRGPGRAMLTMLSYHSAYFRRGGVKAYWYVARLGSRSFRLAAVTRTRELHPGVTYATATIDPPASRFTYRVCFDPPGQAGAGPPAAHARCPH